MDPLPHSLDVVIETPRGSFLKWRSDGRLDFFSPVPAPFNYGSVPDTRAEDGDPLDAVVLGPRRRAGDRSPHQVIGVIRFVDAGERDDKLICGTPPLHPRQLTALLVFFHAYARAKRPLNWIRGRRGPTRCEGYESRS